MFRGWKVFVEEVSLEDRRDSGGWGGDVRLARDQREDVMFRSGARPHRRAVDEGLTKGK